MWLVSEYIPMLPEDFVCLLSPDRYWEYDRQMSQRHSVKPLLRLHHHEVHPEERETHKNDSIFTSCEYHIQIVTISNTRLFFPSHLLCMRFLFFLLLAVLEAAFGSGHHSG